MKFFKYGMIFFVLHGIMSIPALLCQANNKFLVQPQFTPSLENLNTITFLSLSPQDLMSSFQEITVSQLAFSICNNYKNMPTATLLPIKTIDKSIKEYQIVHKGIVLDTKNHTNNIITLYSRGFAREKSPLQSMNDIPLYRKILSYLFPGFQSNGLPKRGGGALSAYAAIRDNFIHTPCISFDYPDIDNLVNIAQSLDLSCLHTIINNIPDTTKMIYMGTSRGATALLKYELLTTTNRHPCVMVLESPIFSLHDTAQQISKTFLWGFPYSAALGYAIFQWLYPLYNPREDNVIQLLPFISNTLPIFIVHLKNDPYVSNRAMFTMVNTLARYNKNIYLLVLEDSTGVARHGALNKIVAFQQAANAFYEQYGLAHDQLLAQQGRLLLDNAYKNASAQSYKEWSLTPCF